MSRLPQTETAKLSFTAEDERPEKIHTASRSQVNKERVLHGIIWRTLVAADLLKMEAEQNWKTIWEKRSRYDPHPTAEEADSPK